MNNYISPNAYIMAFLYGQKRFNAGVQELVEILHKQDKLAWENLEEGLKKEIFSKARSWQASPYNCAHVGEKRVILYNTLTNALARLTHDEYGQLIGKKRLKRDLRLKFLENGFLLADVDARQIYEDFRMYYEKPKGPLSINIATTMRCNARCSYCYEGRAKKKDFSQEALEQTLKFIIQQHDKGVLKMTWFGGEPLLGQDAMDFICAGLQAAGIDYSSYLITNGSLITPELVQKKFPFWKIKDLQISLDGEEKTYSQRKRFRNGQKDMLARILQNISISSEADVSVHLRLNMDEGNSDEIVRFLPELQKHFGTNKNVVYYPAFLTGVGSGLTAEDRIECLYKMFTAIDNPTKFNISRRLYATPRVTACMREDPNSFSIDPWACLYPCEHLVGTRKETLGTVRRLKHKKNQARIHPELRRECKECAYLPKCMGGCAQNLKTGDPSCLIERYMIPAYLQYLAD